MRKRFQTFLIGLVLGLTFGSIGAAWAVSITGAGELIQGWTVTKDDETVCIDPFIDPVEKQITCD